MYVPGTYVSGNTRWQQPTGAGQDPDPTHSPQQRASPIPSEPIKALKAAGCASANCAESPPSAAGLLQLCSAKRSGPKPFPNTERMWSCREHIFSG